MRELEAEIRELTVVATSPPPSLFCLSSTPDALALPFAHLQHLACISLPYSRTLIYSHGPEHEMISVA